ncbi:MAG: pyruvate:ferredoxin (flavodoxin) oxidoreductase [Duncaniella sp.]|uniref:pyruvate:ferredoxin (flavodoxin) oxidoreductase n=1 Tax=Duncaniella sp. TaxID=2518496 RepID=UPI0023BE552A|nr:pyruvate:ferredoxin (flavodoxin) oxidoreductase [Duncaniella sp.]MDE5988578.1 pyruvate:ferredoxin (flavodoxin) oxidoreductase [Duncaniella sp.]
MKKQILDGCTAAAHVAFALSDVATVYPITPIAAMGDIAQKWGLQGRRNLMGQALEVREMESELGAAGAVHGAAAAGALATTFTASQGLMLMIPNMYKISGELLPVVFHVGCRSLATHALSIFGDHQDVMACRATGFTMLASASVQETMDLGLVAHLAAIEGSLPVLHFFDGWRTSSEMDTIDVIDYESMRPLVNWDKVRLFRDHAMNPEHPDLRGSAQNPDVYFQNREAANKYYDAFPGIVQEAMDKVGSLTGRQYHLVDYHGDPEADRVIVVMGSAADVVSETADYLNRGSGYKTGVVKVRLYRPFPYEALRKALPPTVRTVAVLDRTKEPGAQHEPLCEDVITALRGCDAFSGLRIIGGRYGLSSKEFDPSMVKAVFDEMAKESPRNPFTIGITDDVTHLSIPVTEKIETNVASASYQTIFYAIGNDGTVGGTKQVAGIFGNTPGLYAQAYFSYSAKKSGGYTISQLRVGKAPVTSAYAIDGADYVGCHKTSYVNRFAMLDKIKDGGVFVLNSPWTPGQMSEKLPLEMRKTIADKKLRFYNIDADRIAAACGLGPRINMVMETVFLYLSGIIPFEEGVAALKEGLAESYRHEGGDVVSRNLKAVDMAVGALREISYQEIPDWTEAGPAPTCRKETFADSRLESFIKDIHTPCIKGRGDLIPVSAFSPDGKMPMGTTAYEHRRIATRVPVWNADKCVECTECSLVCPHAAIRPFLLSPDEASKAPEGFALKDATGPELLKGYKFHIQNFPEDCLGCSSCSIICPGHALTMTPLEDVVSREVPMAEWVMTNVTVKDRILPAETIKGSQLRQPCLQFSGACAGCGETPYVKLLTQLFGERLLIANATGCSSIWGANYPSNAYCTDQRGKGPAWGNSLFEDNGEYGYGMLVAVEQRRKRVAAQVRALLQSESTLPWLRGPLEAWLSAKDDYELSARTGEELKSMLEEAKNLDPAYADLLKEADMFGRKSVWSIGGDGWAYDIGFAGLDHVLASGEPVKVLVMDTECYSNTGGQTSKATPRSAVAKYNPDGKRVAKKELGRMMMTYGNVYVASVSLGANFQQTIDALSEAERYPGPAIVIAYCPCLNHGIRPGLGHSIVEQRRAVEAGYWPLYRYNPQAWADGRSGLTIDPLVPGKDNSGSNGSSPLTASPTYPNPEPVRTVEEFAMNEDRYADLTMIDPTQAAILRPELQRDCNRNMEALKYLSKKPS